VHGLSDKFLQENGKNPKKVLQELKDFIGTDASVGHNINFDLTMLVENGKRRGVSFDFKEYYDTLDLAKRVVEAPNYRLTTLADLLGLATATHDAEDDVSATVGLLGVLVEKLRKGSPERVALWQEFNTKFLKLANTIESWQKLVLAKRPPEVLEQIWEESGLEEYYGSEVDHEKRQKSVEELAKVFAEKE